MSMLPQKYAAFKQALARHVAEQRIITSPLRLLAYGTDASFYRLIPKLVVEVHSEEEAIATIRLAYEHGLPVTYRAAGTSLSGQAITDSILMVATHHWRRADILDGGAKIRLQPGVTGARANVHLKPYGRKIGPDPASINAAMVGGIASNNASGMCCGTSQNSYKTIADVRLVFYDGTVLDTASSESRASFERTHPEIIAGIKQLRADILADPELTARIHKKFKIKNTTGYSLNALVDYEDPYDIIKHLIIGAEGTLAFISDLTYHTVIDEPYKACTLMIFDTIEAACQAVPALKKAPVSAVELLDRESIRSVENDPEAPSYFRTLPETACVLLVEIRALTEEELQSKEQAIRAAVTDHPTSEPYRFTSEIKEYSFNWKARKGLLSSVGGLRKTGTTCLIEDVAFQIENLAAGCTALKDIFKRLGYHDASLFGHALEGNLHMVFSQDFSTPAEIQRYSDLMDAIAHSVVGEFDGSLKAEHGTGRNMAPFVEMEWGAAAYRIMCRIKALFDPHKVVNPGVIINDNPKVHLENLKPLPAVHELVDKCMECGFCEPNCVAEGLTLSPRQRTVICREIARLRAEGTDPERLKLFEKEAAYAVDETCATDGLCAMACPVKINTGAFVKELRHQLKTPSAVRQAEKIGHHMAGITSVGRGTLSFVHLWQGILGDKLMGGIAGGMRKLSGGAIPQWTPYLPTGAVKIKNLVVNQGQERQVVYFPSCINRTMGKGKGYKSEEVQLTRLTEQLLTRAGYTIIYPPEINDLCCGMAFSSKGFKEEGARKLKELEAALLRVSDHGRIPVLFDMSPCYYTFHEGYTDKRLKVYDPIQFMLEHVMPHLTVKQKRHEVALFTVCSVKKIGMEESLVKLAEMCAERVVSVESNCCGFAGDRGFSYPELNEHGHRHTAEQIPHSCHEGYSTSRTCEIGMCQHSHVDFKSIFYLIEAVTR